MKTSNMTCIALMAAILCILSPISIPTPVSSVAFSLATFAIYLMTYILKPKQALASVGIYLFLGAVGLPVFSGYLSGISHFAAPGGGYLVGYLFLAGISSFFIHRFSKPVMQVLGMLLATLVMYCIGTFWLAYSAEISFSAALPAGMLVFLLPDLVKISISIYIGRKMQKHIKK